MRVGGCLRSRFDHVSLAQCQCDGLLAQRFAEFDFHRIHKGTPRPALLVCRSTCSFAGCHSATRNGPVPMGTLLPLCLKTKLRGSASSASNEGMDKSFSIESISADACTFQLGWSAPRICAMASAVAGASVVKFHSASQAELPMTRACVVLPRHGQSGLRSILGIELYQGIADECKRARRTPVAGSRGIRR